MEFTWLSRWQPQLHAVLRIMTGLLFFEHGLQKFVGFPPGQFAGMGRLAPPPSWLQARWRSPIRAARRHA